MELITVDTKQGMATEVAQWTVGEDSDKSERIIVNIGLDDDEGREIISFYWGNGEESRTLVLPTERVRRLLAPPQQAA